MLRKTVASLCIIFVLAALVPAPAARAESDRVLLVYNDKEQMTILSNLITACGMQPEPVDSVEYTDGMAESYRYVVLQDDGPLEDVLSLGKQVVCIGDSFAVMPGVELGSIGRVVNATLDVYGNSQSVILNPGAAYIAACSGAEEVGSMTIDGSDYPLGVMGDTIFYAPYLNADDLSVFAVAQMLNRYFGRQDGGKMFVMIDEVYPFNDTDMLRLTADKLYENGIPFIMSLMPVYYNTEYPSFTRYTNALRYIQSESGSFVMHDPLVTGNELVGDSLEERMKQAYATFEESGVHVFEHDTFPYAVSMDMLSSIQPERERFISLPIDTVLVFPVFHDETELNDAVNAINKKWVQIGDYRRFFTQDDYKDQQKSVDDDYVYREVTQQQYVFLVNTGNRVLLVAVVVSAVVILGLILLGWRLYRNKFMKKGK